MATEQELKDKYLQLDAHARSLVQDLASLVGPHPSPMVSVFTHEAHRRLEDFLHRCQDIMAVQMQAADENVTKVIDQAVAAGKLQVLEGGVK